MIRRTSLALALLVVATSAISQSVDTPSPPSLPPPPRAGLEQATPLPEDQGSLVQVSGVIKRFLINPNGDVDGFLLSDYTQINVPPHLSSALISVSHVGDSVNISGRRISTTPVVDAQLITDSAGRTLIRDTRPPITPAPESFPALQSMQTNGHVDRVIYGPRGDVAGVLLDDGTSLRMPAPAADQVRSLLVKGQPVSAQGFGIDSPFGRAIQVTAIGRDRTSEQTILPSPKPGAVPFVHPPG